MQDDEELSVIENPLGNPKRPTHSVCASCKQVKPIKDFRTMSTNAQARSWGYNKAIEIISKNCKACRKPKKPLRELTLKELQNKIASGDVKGGAIGNLLKQNKIDEARRKKREGVQQRWHKLRAKEWAKLYDITTKEYNRVRKAKDNTTQHETMIAFNTAYNHAITMVRSKFILEKKMGTTSPMKNQPWHSYIPLDKQAELHELWAQIPAIHIQNIRQPEIFKSKLNQPKENHNESAT